MRILQLLASPFIGGPERQVLGLATALRPLVQTVFLSFAERGHACPFLEEARRQGFEAVELTHNVPRIWAAAREVAGHGRRVRADLICCNGYKPDITGWLAAGMAGIPVVAITHGWTRVTFKVRINEALDRLILRGMDGVVCVSAAQAAVVRAAGVPAARISIIHNAIGDEAFVPPDSRYATLVRRMFPEMPRAIVAAVGRLSAEKGFEVLVDAAALARQRNPGLGFMLFGDGPQRSALERRIVERGLARHFILAGFHADVCHFLPHADLLAMPSYTEGLPVALLEAFAAGLPVVATAVGGIPEVVTDGVNGYLVAPGDAAALAERIVCLAHSPARQAMGAEGRRLVRAEFSTAAQAAAYQRRFEEVLRRGAGQPTVKSVVASAAGSA